MKFSPYIVLLFVILASCGEIKKSEASDNRNINHITTDKPIVGDFDRDKYPILQNAIQLKLGGELKESIEEFNRAEKVYGEMIPIYLNRGDVFDQLGKQNKAVSDFSNCLKLDSTYLPALLNRGLIYAHSNQIEKALSDFNKAIELKPTEPASYLNRAIAYRESGEIGLACSDLKKAKSLGITEKYNSNMTDRLIDELNCKK